MQLTVSNPTVLFFLVLVPVLWIYLYHPSLKIKRPGDRFVFGIMKSLGLLLLLLAFSDIRLPIDGGSGVELIMARDVSLSCSDREEPRIAEFVERLNQMKRKEDRAGSLAFAGQVYIEQPLSAAFHKKAALPSRDRTQTDIEAAIQTALGMFDSPANGRILLLTDGNETIGRASDAAKLAASLGVRIWPVKRRSWFEGDEVYIEDMMLPGKVRVQTPFRFHLSISSTADTQAEILVFKNERIFKQQILDIHPGKTSVSFEDVLDRQGIQVYRAIINPGKDQVFENNEFQGYTRGLEKSRILYLSDASDTPFKKALITQGLNVEILPPEKMPVSFNGLLKYSAVIIDNIPAGRFSLRDMVQLRSFVNDSGGGLLMLGGENSFGAGGWLKTPIEDILPVFMDHPTTLENPKFCLLLLIDTSSSMGGYAGQVTKLEGVKAAAFSAVELLNPFDRVGLLGFDSEYHWVLPITQAGEREKIANELTRLNPIGGTDLYPALSHAFETLYRTRAQKKHIIILSDGKTKQAHFEPLIAQMTKENITISTVAVGDASDRSLMKKIAGWGNGRMYYTSDAARIPRIFTGDTRIAAAQTIVEMPIQPQVNMAHAILEQLPVRGYPEIAGMVTTYPKHGAARIIDTKKGPLLAAWRSGLGKTMVFTSAFDGRWGGKWVEWSYFSQLSAQMVKWLEKSEHAARINADVKRMNNKGIFAVDILDKEGRFANPDNLKLKLVYPSGDKQILELDHLAPGRYQADFKADAVGEYYLTLFQELEQPVLPAQTFFLGVPYADEYRVNRSNDRLLEELAGLTGGRVLSLDDDPESLWTPDPDSRGKRGRAAWPWFVLAFAFVFVIDVALQRRFELRAAKQR